jgi:hypothetical protein
MNMSSNHRPLTEQQIIGCARKILEREFKPGEWIAVGSIYARLFAHPERYGASDVYALPKYPRFERVCRAMFTTKHDEFDGELMIKAGNG